MKTAAIIVNHNNQDDLIKLISRIRNYHILDAVVIVDNKSDDVRSVEEIADIILDPHSNMSPRIDLSAAGRCPVILIKAPRNGGYGYGNNIGMRWAYHNGISHAIIANPDTEFSEDCVRSLFDILGSGAADGDKLTACADKTGIDKTDEGRTGADNICTGMTCEGMSGADNIGVNVSSGHIVAAAAPICRTPESSYEAPVSGWYLKTWGQELLSKGPLCRRIFKNYVYRSDAAMYKQSESTVSRVFTGTQSAAVRVDAVLGSFLAVDVARFNEVGGYDDDVFLYCEENILGQKMKSHGYTTMLLTDQEYIHKHKPGRPGSKAMKYLAESELIYFDRYLRISGFQRLLSRIFLGIVRLEVRCCEKAVSRK